MNISHRLIVHLCVISAAFALLIPGCSKDEPTVPPEETTFESVITNGGVCPVPVPSVVSQDLGNSGEPRDDGTYWDCVTTTYDVTKVPDDCQTFDPSTDIIYPGSLLQGSTLEGNPPDPIITRRTGGTVFISIVNGSQNVAVDVDEVKGSTIWQAMNTIIQENSGVVPANFRYNYAEVFSEQELALALNVSVSTFGNKFSSAMKFKRDFSFHRYIVTLDQMMYTMNYDLPTSYSSVFAPDVTPQELTAFIGAGNPATYISQVGFGRRFYMMVQSTSLRTEVEASIKASFNYATKVSGSMSGQYVNNLENVEITAFCQGGDASLALGAVTGGPEELKAFLTEGGTIQTGVPLCYRVRNLLDGREVKVKVTGEYDVKNCTLESYTVPDSVKVAWFRADTLVTLSPSNSVARWGDAFGRMNDAVRIGGSADYNPVMETVGGLPSIHFPINVYSYSRGAWPVGDCAFVNTHYRRQNLPGAAGEGLEFDGGALVGSSYTIMAMVQMDLGYFLTGSSGNSLTAGYGTANLWSVNNKRPFDHGYDYDCAVSVSNTSLQLQLFTMIYDERDSSLKVFVNGLQRGETVKGIGPLGGFPDATLGAWRPYVSNQECAPGWPALNVNPVNISEVILFKKALTADQRKLYEDALKAKYLLPPM
jgi:hypothetical protein